MPTSSVGAVLQAMNTVYPVVADIEHQSPNHSWIHAGGRHVENALHKIDGNGAQLDNLFTVVGTVRLLSLRGFAITVTDSTTFSNVKFEVDDGAAQSDLCTIVNASGVVAGGMLLKQDVTTAALTFLNANTHQVQDPLGGGPPPLSIISAPAVIMQKLATTTYIRISFTGDANTDIDMDFELEYEPLSDDGVIASV
jgi:hypothetical protein